MHAKHTGFKSPHFARIHSCQPSVYRSLSVESRSDYAPILLWVATLVEMHAPPSNNSINSGTIFAGICAMRTGWRNFITHICAYCRIISVLCVFRFLMTFINGLNIFTLSIRLRTSGVKCVNAWWSEQDTNCVIPIFTFRCWFGNITHMRKVFAPFGWYP